MNLANKTFKDNKTGALIKVLDSFENIAILENKERVDVRRLMDNNFYTEQIDPNSFFNNQGAYNQLADKIKSISTENIKDDPEDIVVKMGGTVTPTTNESAVVYTTEDDERAELARKYGASVDNVSSTNKQNEAFARLLGEEGAEELPKIQQRVEPIVNEVQRIEASRNDQPKSYEKPQQVNQQVDDPIITMFRNVKKGVDFKMNIEISNKIPRVDFIEMMEDSYETSIIDFLAEEFTNKLLSNPQHIKNMISDRIKQIVYGGEKPKKEISPVLLKKEVKVEVKKSPRKKATISNDKKTNTKKKVFGPLDENKPEKSESVK